ncbi:hypothetical protein [Herbaspirillum sp.]|uniref:hypothetical protein n=1 Tax=Herbaspirillum sp. TaxID=1890675 RepID=UPI002588D05A|nr:hypothetical protein [Herbaspirillum sp.]MCP3946329.1 hypothetical protein [Herbaspirillum sp.]
MTDFKNMLGLCGPSRREAADYFEVREDTVKNWSSGRTSPPDNVVDDLAWLWGQIYTAANGETDRAHLPEWAQGRVDALALMKLVTTTSTSTDGTRARRVRVHCIDKTGAAGFATADLDGTRPVDLVIPMIWNRVDDEAP